jgi:protein SCO1
VNKQRAAAAPLAGTLMACAAVLLGFGLALHALTGGFEHWTFEDMRREDARQGRLVATALSIRTSQGTQRLLWSNHPDDNAVVLVNFIYTACPTVCQTLGAEYTQMQQAVATQASAAHKPIKLVSLSFDTEHDGPAQLDAHARLHRADSSVWTIAAPTTRTAAARVLNELGVVVIPDGLGGYVHNGSIHVMNPAGRVLAIYDDVDWQEALALATRLAETVP